MRRLILFFAALVLTATAHAATNQQGETYNYLPDYSKCVKVYNGGTQSNGQKVMRFYNGCAEKLYFKACVKEYTGAVKLYTSPRKVPTNGNWTIYTFPDVDPKSVNWVASPFIPPTPGPCSDEVTTAPPLKSSSSWRLLGASSTMRH